MTKEKENLIPEEVAEVVESGRETAGKDRKAEGKVALKKGLLVMLIALVIGALLGFGATSIVLNAKGNKEKTFTASEFQITLTEGFSEKLMENVTMAYSSRNMGVSFRKSAFTSSNKEFSAEQYAVSIMLASGIVSEVKADGDLTYFATNGTSAGGRRMTSFVYIFKTEKCFWVAEFNVRQNQAGRYEKTIKNYAESIVFN